ncbi:MAG: Na/Pi symporter [Bdellovibrionota bacterium]|nr:Na/Pi symporter [Bdellovibrionota bacterium]
MKKFSSVEVLENEKADQDVSVAINYFETVIRILAMIALLFIFLVGIKVLTSGIKSMGGGFAKTLFDLTDNPMMSLLSGILATSLLQSSSTTTSIIVGLVSGGALTVPGAIPMIMGANLGTSVTNTIVSLAYVKDTDSFKKSFAAATVHDFFNVLSVAIILPLELMTGFISKMATDWAHGLYGNIAGYKFSSPLKASIKPFAKSSKIFVTETLGLSGNAAGGALMFFGAIITIFALTSIVKVMKKVVENNKGQIIEKLLSKNPYAAIAFGALLTISVQSSSITTSLLVPMAGTGILSLYSIFPVTIGANIGTTTTALLASMTGNVAGLSIALVHFIFNVVGTLIWFPSQKMRRVPLLLAEKLAELSSERKYIGLLYIACVFFIIPLSFVFVLK